MRKKAFLTLATVLLITRCVGDREEIDRLRADNQRLNAELAALKSELDQIKFGPKNLLNSANVAANEHHYEEAERILQDLLAKYPISDEATSAKQILNTVQEELRKK